MVGPEPAHVTIRCADSASAVQYMHIGHTSNGLVALRRGGGASLWFEPAAVALVIVAIASHLHWIVSKAAADRPVRLSIDCIPEDDKPPGRLHVESDDDHVLLLREGGVYLYFPPRAAMHLLHAITAHGHWAMGRRTA